MKAFMSLLGQACGDAYGMPFEEWKTRTTRYHDALPHKSISGGFLRLNAGEITDDTEMCILTLQSMIGNSTHVDLYDIQKRYVDYIHITESAGQTTKNALLHNIYNCDAHTNGSLMKIFPVAAFLFELWGEHYVEEIIEEVSKISCLTHISPIVRDTEEEMIRLFANPKHMNSEFIEEMSIKPSDDVKIGDVHYTAYRVLKALRKNFPILLEGFKEIVSEGGDTDTYCAIYGAFYGYWYPERVYNNWSWFLNPFWHHVIEKLVRYHEVVPVMDYLKLKYDLSNLKRKGV